MDSKDITEIRSSNFKRNIDLEAYLKDINLNLWIAEKEIIKSHKTNKPVIFIVGAHRSGSTLILQWLANTKQFSYPTNLLSRFYNAPIIGAKIQRLLTDKKYNFRNEIMDFNSEVDFHSENGKTKGALSPNEFWYFWRRFLPFEDLDYLPNEKLLKEVDNQTFKNEVYGIAEVFEKPFALKAMICNYNIGFLNEIFENAIFVYTKRDPYTNVESALNARKRQLGSERHWYSFKIPEYYDLMEINDPIKQTAGQIYYINKAVETGLEDIEDKKKLVVNYEEFCDNPEKYYQAIYKKLKLQGYEINKDYHGPKSFNITRTEVSNDRVIHAYNDFVKNY
jgi:hypothetical protein